MAESYTYDSGGAGSLPGGGDPDYSSLATWEAATDNDLSSIGISTLECYDSQTHNDSVDIAGATNTDATHYRRIRSAPSCATPFAGKDGTGATLDYSGSASRTVAITEAYSRAEQMTIRYSGSYGSTSVALSLGAAGAKAVFCVIPNCINTNASYVCRSVSVAGLGAIAYGCIVYGGDGVGFLIGAMGTGISAAVCCTAIGNAGYGFEQRLSNTRIVWGCYAADNTSGDFNASWSAGTDYNASADASAPGSNSSASLDLSLSLDADYIATAALGYGRNPYNDLSGTSDFEDFLRNDTSGDALFPVDIAGNDRPDESTADSEWDVGASQYVAAGGTTVSIIPIITNHLNRMRAS